MAGSGAGFISYAVLKAISGKGRDVSLPMWIASAAFLVYFADPWLRQFIK